MRLSAFSGIIASMYTDSLDVYRYASTANADKSTSVTIGSTPVHSNVPCRVSFIKVETPLDNSPDGVPIITAIKLFFATNQDISEGDFIVVRKLGTDGSILAVFSGNVGLPSVYETHKEALIKIWEMA